MPEQAKKTVELWEGFEVEVNQQLLDDFDFVQDLNEASNTNNLADMVAMYMAVIGGEEVYEKIRDHITAEHGYMSQKALGDIMEKISAFFPKGGNRQQRRYSTNTR